MNEFEFLAVFISLVVGLGVTHILYGLARVIYSRDRHRVSAVHMLWTLNVLLILLLNWWVLFLWADKPQWSFDIYLLLIGWGIALYMLAVTIFPPDLRGNEDYEAVFANNRKWLLGTFLVFLVLDITQTAVRGQLFEPRIYLPYMLHYFVLAAAGFAVDSPRYQRFLAWYVFLTLALWSIVVRRFLGA